MIILFNAILRFLLRIISVADNNANYSPAKIIRFTVKRIIKIVETEPAAPFWRKQALLYKCLAKPIIFVPLLFEDD